MAKVDTSIWEQNTEAVREFTDREEPQEAFERKFRVFCDDWKDEYYVLCYYGIGGIGKTSFANKLRRVIRGEEKTRLLEKIDCNYIEYNFDAKNSSLDKEGILASFRNQLMKINKDFQFFRFNYALCCYAQKTGKAEEKEEAVKSLLEKTPWLKRMFSLAEFIPVVSSVTSLVKKIDSLTSDIRGIYGDYMDKKHFRDYLFEIDRLEAAEIFDKLHEYFCLDMIYNMQHVAKKPIVAFIDTYEKYIDTINQEIGMIIEDYWLRKGKKSVIRSIPGVLWVITGREKLYWSNDDDWDEFVVDSPLSEMTNEEKEILAKTELEQHLLGDLSEVDAIGFLSKAGINNKDLCKQLYELTNGTPLFLDMCVENYNEVFTGEVIPTIDMFGKDLTQLISRYLYNMNEANREMLYFLSCLGKWDDDTVKEIASKATSLRNYTYAKYKDFINHAFIIEAIDGSYYLHETVRNAALKNADEEIVSEISELHIIIAKNKLEESAGVEGNVALTEYIKICENRVFAYKEIYENVKLVKKHVERLIEVGNYDLAYTISNKFLSLVGNSFPNTKADYFMRGYYGEVLCRKGYIKEALGVVEAIPIYARCVREDVREWLDMLANISNVYISNGLYKKCKDLRNIQLEESVRILGEDHLKTLNIKLNLAIVYTKLDDYEKSIELYKEVYEKRRKILGEDHLKTMAVMNGLADLYTKLDDYEKSIELYREVYEKRKKILGEDHLDVLRTMLGLAVVYSQVGNYEKSIELYREVYEKRKKILGEDHPQTMAVMNNLSVVYTKLGDYEKSIELQKEVYEKRRKILGEDHPDTLSAMNNLANVYSELGDYQKSIELHKKVCEKSKRILGENHSKTLTVMNNLANGYSGLGDYEKSIELQKEVYEKIRKTLGEDHTKTLIAMRNLAIIYTKLGDYEKSIELQKEVYEKRRKILGEGHPQTMAAMNSLTAIYAKLDNYEKSIELKTE